MQKVGRYVVTLNGCSKPITIRKWLKRVSHNYSLEQTRHSHDCINTVNSFLRAHRARVGDVFEKKFGTSPKGAFSSFKAFYRLLQRHTPASKSLSLRHCCGEKIRKLQSSLHHWWKNDDVLIALINLAESSARKGRGERHGGKIYRFTSFEIALVYVH